MVGRRKKIPLLNHRVKLEGAKYPHDVFTIDLPAEGMQNNNYYTDHGIVIVSCNQDSAFSYPLFCFPDPNSQPAEALGDLSAAGMPDKLTIRFY